VGTCDVLRHFATRIQQDFVLLPCDFIPSPSFDLTRILDKFRTEATYDGAIATACFYEAPKPEKSAIVEEWGMVPQPLPIVWDERTGTLLHIDTPDDVDRNGEDLQLTMSLLSR
jgi:translation initiation factor eIF-2B subunit gamma